MGRCSILSAVLLVTFLPKGCHSQVCGSASLNPRVVGGADAFQGHWPWMVYLEFNDTSGQLHLCGGTLISRKWILTAAHCLEDTVVELTKAYLGVHNLSSVGPEAIRREVTVGVVHPSYDNIHLDNDIALLQMSAPVPYNGLIQPLCLAQKGSTFHTGVTAWVTGWGALEEEGNDLPDVLQEVSVPIVGDEECRCLLGVVPDKTICAGFAEGGKDSCQGDSGGPLVAKQGSLWVQAGVVSFGDGCAKRNRPGVYTEVSEFQDWIQEVVGTEDPPGFVRYTSEGEDSDWNYNCTSTSNLTSSGTTTPATTRPTSVPLDTTIQLDYTTFTTTTKTSNNTSSATVQVTTGTTARPTTTTLNTTGATITTPSTTETTKQQTTTTTPTTISTSLQSTTTTKTTAYHFENVVHDSSTKTSPHFIQLLTLCGVTLIVLR